MMLSEGISNQEGVAKAQAKTNGRRTAAKVPDGTVLSATVEKEALASALKRVAAVVEARNTIPIIGTVHIASEKGKMTITGTDLAMWASEKVSAEVLTSPFAVAVNAHKLEDVVSCFPAGAEIKITTTDERGARLRLSSGRLVYNIGRLKADDFPHANSVLPFSTDFKVKARELHHLFSKTSHAISTNETRYYLNGVYLHGVDIGEDKRLRAVATDGHRLARVDTNWPDGAPPLPTDKGVIVSRKTVGRIVSVMAGAGEKDEVLLAISPSQIRMAHGDFTLVAQLIDGSYPDYARVVPTEAKGIATVGGWDLKKAIDHVSRMSSEKVRAVKFNVMPDKLALSSSTNGEADDYGDSSEDIGASFTGPDPLEIGFNARYALDALANCEDGDIEIRLSDPGDPAVIVAPGHTVADAPLLFVLMPIRV